MTSMNQNKEGGTSQKAKKRFSSKEEKVEDRALRIGRKKCFTCTEYIEDGQPVNILEGLELHTNVFSHSEQRRIIKFIWNLQQKGRNRDLQGRTYCEPHKWMPGKGRVTIQFGCCYNYAVDKEGNPPGILQAEQVDEIPSMLKVIIKRLVQWHVLPASCVPDSCIVNIYDVGDCIPPHIDHHDFLRPFCTLSLLTECNIVFGSKLFIVSPGKFEGSFSLSLSVGSVLVFNGNSADIAKHAIPAVPSKRISITFRKMHPSKRPYGFSPDFYFLNECC
ncbi:hypothetical protein KP509_11G072400 [Ceratopteris richardii]|uniref:Fe2OG dioxygenase domain-containing protein n=1 Tax=Ceratopteris richardii TaxID=49495 RepID=A0A8T2TTR9_CERRI|nr:hypothetical protein KP509_11G072400 [Ceratopteris richardii]KAH7425809.1 hypothetical protein KP509_11G072400 [Ceratopteris richardii]